MAWYSSQAPMSTKATTRAPMRIRNSQRGSRFVVTIGVDPGPVGVGSVMTLFSFLPNIRLRAHSKRRVID